MAQTTFNRCTSEGVQIHHTGKIHWITSSSIGGQQVKVYDSLYDDLIESTEKQLTQCYYNRIDHAGQLPVIQRQKGSTDCGLFAIAYAYEIASGNGHACNEIVFGQSAMRHHWWNALKKKKSYRSLVPHKKRQQ